MIDKEGMKEYGKKGQKTTTMKSTKEPLWILGAMQIWTIRSTHQKAFLKQTFVYRGGLKLRSGRQEQEQALGRRTASTRRQFSTRCRAHEQQTRPPPRPKKAAWPPPAGHQQHQKAPVSLTLLNRQFCRPPGPPQNPFLAGSSPGNV